ncbi:hypothetical protein E2562_016611 [Oryza meyeriana var. granulata]|uniref:TF-B3 domain-containing protein n=1 Tax=Oryza meyeriana var. granulata TaxID=110450 RepID=A0A6G1EM35_9ORYZ|nr:hypothetical protein E2562_016611 [Oryza meyeriana var. granulata]
MDGVAAGRIGLRWWCRQYLAELLQEHQKLGPFMQVLPICSRLLNQEIMRVSGMFRQPGVGDFDRLPPASPNQMHPSHIMPNFGGNSFGPWNGMRPERVSFSQGPMGWQGAAQSPSSYIVKKILRLEIPTDAYPNFNFIGRLLGPRGNSLKRIEASTGCRVFIRGKGSIKDPNKEEQLKGRAGYEHLDDPLHILIEAELPANVIDARLAKAQEILEELLKPVDLGIKKMSKSLLQAARLQKSPRASPKPRKKFEATEVRRSSRARNSVSYKEDFDELDSFLRRRSGSRNTEQGRDYTGRIASYEQQQRAFKRAERLQNRLDPENPSFVKTMVRSHVSSCFWLGLPTRFCKLHLPPREFKMVLEDEEGGEFDCVYIGNRTGLSGGWRGFAMHHNLEDGDSLVFELVEPDRFKIYVIKAADEDVNESESVDEEADGDKKDTSAKDAAEQNDSPDAEPLKGAKRRKLRGRR